MNIYSHNVVVKYFNEKPVPDVEPPVFDICPSTVVAGTDTGVNTAEVVWKTPTGKDNSKIEVNINLKSSFAPKSKLTAGQYDITYGITDKAGNVGQDCKFSVVVRGIYSL